jgi:acyl carrier protein
VSKTSNDRIDRLIRKFFRLAPETPLPPDSTVESLGANEWLIIELAIAVEAEFGLELSAEQALALETVGDWRRLVQDR